MKAKIKALRGKMVRLYWGTNRNPHNTVGVIMKLRRVQFDFKRNGEKVISIRFDNVTDIKEI